jgi:hypothetical protein
MARGERTGRKAAATEHIARRIAATDRTPIPFGAYSIAEFCVAHGIAESMYFKMRAAGEGPDEMELGRRRTISVESAVARGAGRGGP